MKYGLHLVRSNNGSNDDNIEVMFTVKASLYIWICLKNIRKKIIVKKSPVEGTIFVVCSRITNEKKYRP